MSHEMYPPGGALGGVLRDPPDRSREVSAQGHMSEISKGPQRGGVGTVGYFGLRFCSIHSTILKRWRHRDLNDMIQSKAATRGAPVALCDRVSAISDIQLAVTTIRGPLVLNQRQPISPLSMGATVFHNEKTTVHQLFMRNPS